MSGIIQCLQRPVVNLLLLFGVLAFPGLAAPKPENAPPALPEEFELVELAFAPSGVFDLREDSGEVTFDALGRRFELELVEAPLFAPGARVVWRTAQGRDWLQTPRGVYLKGVVKGEPGSRVRLRIEDGQVEGFIQTEEDGFLLEAAEPYFPGVGKGETIIHRLSRAAALEGGLCGADWLPGIPAGDKLKSRAGADYLAGASAGVSGEIKEVELRLFLDSFYSRRNGVNSAERAHSLVHQINAIFEREFGVTLKIAETVVSTDPARDVVSGSTDATILLNELGRSKLLAGADLVHLFTGRDLNGGTLGVAWMGSVCNPEFAVGLSQDLSAADARLVTAAHELAHGLGARHDGSGYCRAEGPQWIMWPQLNAQATSFSTCSRNLVELNLPRFACVRPPAQDPLPAPHPISPSNVSGQMVRFEWESVAGAEGYTLEVIEDATSEVVIEAAVQETYLQPSLPFPLDHRYRWRVGTLRDKSVTARTEWQTFSVTGWRRLPRH